MASSPTKGTKKSHQPLITQELEPSVKILVVGNGSVGKSSLIRRFCKGVYNQAYTKTIGVEYQEKDIAIDVPGSDGESGVKLMVWDTAGQREFDSITKKYYEEANAVALIFSTTDRDSFETIKSWRKKVEAVGNDLAMVLVQNKIDMIGDKAAAVSNEETEALARDLNLKFYRVSVKDDVNVKEVFQYLAELALKRMQQRNTSITIASVLNANSERPPHLQGAAQNKSASVDTSKPIPELESTPVSILKNSAKSRPHTARSQRKSNDATPVDIGDGSDGVERGSVRPGTASGKKGDCLVM